MNEVALAKARPEPYVVGEYEGKTYLWLFNNSGRKALIYVQDVPLMKAWKSGSALTRDQESQVMYYIGRLEQVWASASDAADVKEKDVDVEGPLEPPVTRVSTADTERYITIRDGLSSTLVNEGGMGDELARQVAESIMNDFNLELPNT